MTTNNAERSPANSWRVRTWQGAVWLVALAIIFGCYTITLGGSMYHAQGWGDSTYHEHGWPWQFGTRFIQTSHDRFQFWQALRWTDLDHPQLKLVGDLAIFIVAAAVVVWITRRVVRNNSAKLTLRWVLMVVTLVCIACGYFAAHRHAALAEKTLVAALYANDSTKDHIGLRDEYIGPRWLLRLVGDSKWFGGTFDRVTSVDLRGDSDELTEIGRALSQLHYLQWVNCQWFDDKHLLQLLRSNERWQFQSLWLVLEERITSAGLSEIGRCPNLREIIIDGTQVDDVGVKYLLQCPQLEMIDATATRITVASVPVFAQMKNLDDLTLIAMDEYLHPEDIPKFRALPIKRLYLPDP